MKENNEEIDKQIIASAFFKQLDLVWSLVKYISTIEVGTLIGWYYLNENYSHLASLLLFVSVILLIFVIILIQRHSILLERYRVKLGDTLKKPNTYPGTNKDFSEPNIKFLNINIRGHVTARLIAFFLVIVNFILFIYELKLHLFHCLEISLFLLYYISIFILMIIIISIVLLTHG